MTDKKHKASKRSSDQVLSLPGIRVRRTALAEFEVAINQALDQLTEQWSDWMTARSGRSLPFGSLEDLNGSEHVDE